MNGRIWAFAIYSICYEVIVWGIFGYAVFILGHSGWWIVAAIFVSGCQLKPKWFGLAQQNEEATRGGEQQNSAEGK